MVSDMQEILYIALPLPKNSSRLQEVSNKDSRMHNSKSLKREKEGGFWTQLTNDKCAFEKSDIGETNH